MGYLDNTGLTYLWERIKAYVAGLGFYTKPSTGIPASDMANGVIPTVPTTLSSFTDDLGSNPAHTHSQYLTSETEPDFNGSAAATITSSDISNWNGKTSNVGTITGITMNNTSKGTSGVVDLGTVITEHQSLSNCVQKSQTSGLLKNDGTVDTSTYLTSAPVTSVNGQTGAVTLTIPSVPSNLVIGSSSSYTIWTGTAAEYGQLPSYDNSTLYFITS